MSTTRTTLFGREVFNEYGVSYPWAPEPEQITHWTRDYEHARDTAVRTAGARLYHRYATDPQRAHHSPSSVIRVKSVAEALADFEGQKNDRARPWGTYPIPPYTPAKREDPVLRAHQIIAQIRDDLFERYGIR